MPKFSDRALFFSCHGLFYASVLALALSSCTSLPSMSSNKLKLVTANFIDRTTACVNPLWTSRLTGNWQKKWQVRSQGQWGKQNIKVMADPSRRFDRLFRVHYPRGSASPTVTREEQSPQGGSQFYAKLNIQPQDSLHLSYYVRFSENFNFVKGGKLPGLFGGAGNTGGRIPTGADGFSTRFMWRRQGDGEVYAYLPTSRDHGTSIGRGNWRFRPGNWYHLEQSVNLNQPGQADGQVQVWVNGQRVLNRQNLEFRTTESLQIEGILFSTFFGGDDPSWATPVDTYADFADFQVTATGPCGSEPP